MKTLITLISLSTLLVCLSALAQTAPDARFKSLDKNGDGKLSREEIGRRTAQRFDTLDKNGDGFITMDEMPRERRTPVSFPGANAATQAVSTGDVRYADVPSGVDANLLSLDIYASRSANNRAIGDKDDKVTQVLERFHESILGHRPQPRPGPLPPAENRNGAASVPDGKTLHEWVTA